jgi:hypothetical protein
MEIHRTLTWDYLAGLLDGEGSIMLYCPTRKKGATRRVQVSQAGPLGKLLLDAIREEFGGVVYRQTGRAYVWLVQSKKQIGYILRKLAPLLIIKQSQAIVMLEHLDGEIDAPTAAAELKRLKKEA